MPAILLAAGTGLVQTAGRQERAPLPRPLRELPTTIAGATGIEREMTADEFRAAGVTDYLFRVFRRDSINAFSVYVGYYDSQATGRTIHSPRNCLPGSGWQVVESATRDVELRGAPARVNRYIIANGETQALVLYWYQGRGRVAHSEYGVKWELLRDAASRGRTEEALVRIVVPIAPSRGFSTTDWRERLGAAEATALQVAGEMLPMLDAALPKWT